jgi:TonB family protein
LSEPTGDDSEEGGDPGSEESSLSVKRWKQASFFNRVKEQVRRHWSPAPVWRRADPDGKKYGTHDRYTLLFVRIDGEGRLIDVHLETPSGVEFLDELAVAAFTKAAPFANPPQAILEDDHTLQFKFGFYFEVGGGKSSGAPSRAAAFERFRSYPAVTELFRPSSLRPSPARAHYLETVCSRVRTTVSTVPSKVLASPARFAKVNVTLDATGRLLVVRITTSSGADALDQLAVQAVRAAAPFPPASPEFVSQKAHLVFDLAFHLDNEGATPKVIAPELLRDRLAQRMRAAIITKWQPPPGTPPAATVLRVRTNPTGTLAMVELIRSSGAPAHDEAWRRAARVAAPYDPIAPELAPIFAEGVLVELTPPPSMNDASPPPASPTGP